MHDVQSAWVYILPCADGSFYVGSHRGPDVSARVEQHRAGHGGDYTSRRLPVTLVWCSSYQYITDAIAMERKLKRWSRAKKIAFISGDWDALSNAARRRAGRPRPSRPPSAAPQDEAFLSNNPLPEEPLPRASKDQVRDTK